LRSYHIVEDHINPLRPAAPEYKVDGCHMSRRCAEEQECDVH
jgi:hypothetical protein